MNIDKINQLFDTGLYSEMLKAGFISYKVSTYREVYLWVDAQMIARNIKREAAVLEAQVLFNLSERTVWRAVSAFTK